MSIGEIYTLFLEHPGICTDSRHIVPDSLFFALKGPNFNGNAYAAEALEKGASRDSRVSGRELIECQDGV